MRVMIFAGTRKGRELAMDLADLGHDVTVSSLTEHGRNMVGHHPNLTSIFGKLDEADIMNLLEEKKIDVIIDSTHPYAVEISNHLLTINHKTGKRLVRFERQSSIESEVGIHFPSMKKACDYLRGKEGPVLFTTGVNQVGLILSILPMERVYVRVLPVKRSVAMIEDSGLSDHQVIFQHPPFDKEANIHQIRTYGVKYLVTKDSGADGNTEEKVKACEETGVQLVVIDRPRLPFEEVYYERSLLIQALE